VPSPAFDDFAFLPATEQLAALDSKGVSSADLVELYLSRIAEHNAPLNAVVTVDADGARRAAKQADAAPSEGQCLGPLHGLPITVKDSYETAGMRTVCGRPDLVDHVPTQDAEAVARLRRSGAIILGKTNMPTGNADVQASNPVFGRANNPWDQSRTSGGSAGGGAAATAAGLASFDFGSEIGGSTRIPAHFCGLYGHKSTWQSVPLVGHIPGGPGDPGRWGEADMACAGVQVRGARDIIPALEATVGPLNPDGGFSYTLAPPRATVLKDFRVAVWADDPDCPIDKDVRNAIDVAVAALRDAGARVAEKPASIPVDIATSHDIFLSLVYGAFSVDRSTLSPRSGAALAFRSLTNPRGDAATRDARNDAEPPCVVVP
jgi:amidase